mmetsp:Transcript_81897/g.149670  ORF Transcript_81897/g.149670 Transcript_81897/m.149670 type:complete len:223 (-) Transcript_81897:1164-1832(-)
MRLRERRAVGARAVRNCKTRTLLLGLHCPRDAVKGQTLLFWHHSWLPPICSTMHDPRILAGLRGTGTLIFIFSEQLQQEGSSQWIHVRRNLQLLVANLVLVFLKRPPISQNAEECDAERPDVCFQPIVLPVYLGRPMQLGCHLLAEPLHWLQLANRTKIAQADTASVISDIDPVHEEIVAFEVSVYDATAMQVFNRVNHLCNNVDQLIAIRQHAAALQICLH